MTRARAWARWISAALAPGTAAALAWARARWIYAALLLATAAIGLAAATTVARSGRSAPAPAPAMQENTAYNGKWIWVRLRYRSGYGGGGFRRRGGDDGWFHDYPDAERNLTRLIGAISEIKPGVEGGNIIDLGDPELHKYPIAYLSEPGFQDNTSGGWDMNDQEVANMRAYLLKGGFLIVDDFPYAAWPNFDAQMRRMLPELEPIVLDATHPIFHTFFDIESLERLHISASYGARSAPVFVGYFEDNDPKKRMLVMANYQNDLGEYWEYSERGFSYVGDGATSEAYKFGINYIVYGLTH